MTPQTTTRIIRGDDVDQIINRLTRSFKTNDPFTIASGINILIRFEDLPPGTRGIYYRILRRRFIVLDSKLCDLWQRFVCAHELGHDRLHPDISRFWFDQNTLFHAGKFERQANQFAVRLLTQGESPQCGEPVCGFLKRNNVPDEMKNYY